MSEYQAEQPAQTPAGGEPAETSQAKKEKVKKPLWREILEWVLTIVVALAATLVIRTALFELVRVDGTSMLDTLQDKEIMFVTKTGYSSLWLSLPWQDDETKEAAPKFTFFGDPARFDVVVCRYPGRGDTNFVKRVVGLPGDTVEIRDGYLYVNNERYEEPYVNDAYRENLYHDYEAVTVPAKGDVLTCTDDGMLQANGGEYSYGFTEVLARDGNDILLTRQTNFGLHAELNGRTIMIRDGVWYLDAEAQNANPLAGRSFTVEDDYFFVMGDHRNNSNDSRAQGAIRRSYVMGHVQQVLFPFNAWRGIPNGLNYTK